MSTTRKKQIFEAMKFQTIKIAKFYSSEIKWVYSIIYTGDGNCRYNGCI